MAKDSVRSIQFTEREQVEKAFSMAKMPWWAIVQGNQFLFNYEGANMEDSMSMLKEHLDLIEDSGAIYTLKVYKKQAGDLNEKTPCNGSFNFRLTDYSETPFGEVHFSKGSGNALLLSKLNAIEEKLKRLEEDEEDEDEDQSSLGQITELIQNPVVMGLIGKLFSGNAPNKPAALAGVDESRANELLSNALNVLKEKDEHIAIHLDKLSKIAVNNPIQFKMLLSMLDSM